MSHARFRPADHSKGDESTIGGYAAVHDRPAAFEGSDGFSYSVELMTEQTPNEASPWAAFILFVKWARLGAQTPEGHLESDYLTTGATEREALERLGRTPLADVKTLLDELIVRRQSGAPQRRWWDAMNEESDV
jgi:hypothetical protein